MLFESFFSALYLLTSTIAVNPSIEVIHQHHLETSEGRTTFLVDKLTPYAATANQLNQEIGILSQAVQILSSQDDQQVILSLTEITTKKMSQLTAMLPVLDLAMSVNEDFLQIEPILHQTGPLTSAQQEIVNGISALCNSIDSPAEQ